MGESVSKKEKTLVDLRRTASLYRLPDEELDRFLHEDCPYGDLTTALLGIGAKLGRIAFSTRHETVVCCTEEAARLLEKLGCTTISFEPSGTMLPAGSQFLSVEGTASALHMGWKVTLNLLEAASGVATRTHKLVEAARSVDPSIEVVATRKVFPGTKSIATKAVYAGGASPHRLGLSETVLVFDHHTTFLDQPDDLHGLIPGMQCQAREKRIAVEATDLETALKAAEAGAEVIQIDKMSPDRLRELVSRLREAAPKVIIAAAGGVNDQNAQEYAATGVDLLVTSSMYWGKPADIAVSMEPLTL